MLSNYNFFLKQVALAMGTISCILTIFIGIWPRFNCSCMWGVLPICFYCLGLQFNNTRKRN